MSGRPLAVVIVTYLSAGVIEDCLRSVRTAIADLPAARVIVVDNASDDDTRTLVARIAPGAEIIARDSNDGFAAGVNAGIVAAGEADVLVLNPDIRLNASAVHALRAALDVPGTGIAVPVLRDADGMRHASLRRRPTVLRALGEALLGGYRAGRVPMLGELTLDEGAYQRPGWTDWATGAAWLVSRECIVATGYLDERYFLYSEETEYMLRAGDRGFAVRFEPSATAVHLGGDQATSPTLWALGATNKVRLHRERHGRLAATGMWLALLLNELLRTAVQRGNVRAVHGRAVRELLTMRRWPRRPGTTRGSSYVCFAAQDWWYHNQAHSDFQLMRAIAAHRRVLVVNSIGMRMPVPGRSTHVARRIARKLRSVTKLVRRPLPELPNFHVMSPLPFPFYSSAFARRLGAALVRAQVRLVCALLRLGEPVILVTIPTAWDVVQPMPKRKLVYNRSDLHSAFPESDRDAVRTLENALLRNADHVLYVSHALLDQEHELTSDRAYFLDHGVDVTHFSRRPTSDVPDDLAAIPSPRIGFFGALDDYVVDFGLLERIATELPDASLVLIGDSDQDLSRFDKYPNVHLLGFRRYEDIPAYGSGFDVAIMPWRPSEWIRFCNPIKLKEYLALGLPVVSTEFAELAKYADLVTAAGDHTRFVAALRQVLADGPAQRAAKLRESVLDSTWDARATELLGLAETPDNHSFGSISDRSG
jgi:GT2 family glycosyltransferase/glycosyltransferase involved in cell wall biosynthesis